MTDLPKNTRMTADLRACISRRYQHGRTTILDQADHTFAFPRIANEEAADAFCDQLRSQMYVYPRQNSLDLPLPSW